LRNSGHPLLLLRELHQGVEGVGMTDTVWQCEQLRAGQVYSKELFQTREEAEEFVAKMARVAPDIFCRIEPIDVEKVWN
jgi:hypothetical protein